ncbi:MAG: Uma2 family endonuclease [Cyanobacteria bacterium]|jgi:Uma2 family endonuclease|nr:Uma2 family endonuclease [Cyanobacteria bacterium GSL.Bin1]
MTMQSISNQSQLFTLEEFLAYDDGSDQRYELVDGELVEMPPETQGNLQIAKYLLFEWAKYLPLQLIALGTELEVTGKRSSCRVPDLLLHTEESLAALPKDRRATITRDMPPPALVVEIVSPGQENRDRDYRYKHTEYAARGITEYWIIDRETQQVTVCLWVNGKYEDTVYTGDTPLKSTVIPEFNLSASQILRFAEN